MSEQHVRAFIVYAHESEPHRARCLELAHRLRHDGIDALIDQHVTAPPEGWPRWMQRQIDESRFVLVVCTPTLRHRFEGNGPSGVGQGTAWEGFITAQSLHESQGRNEKFVPVRFATEGDDAIPRLLRPYSRYVIPNDYEHLYRHLTGQPAVVPPPLGRRRTMPSGNAATASPLGGRHTVSSGNTATAAAGPHGASGRLDHVWWRYAAMASIAGHFLVALSMPKYSKGSVGDVLAMLVFLLTLFTAPSIRTLVDRRRRKVADVLHWIWIGLWVVMLIASFSAPARDVGAFILFPLATSLGIASSAAFLLRLRQN